MTEMYEEEDVYKDSEGSATEFGREKIEEGIIDKAFHILQGEIIEREFLMKSQSAFKDLHGNLIEYLFQWLNVFIVFKEGQ